MQKQRRLSDAGKQSYSHDHTRKKIEENQNQIKELKLTEYKSGSVFGKVLGKKFRMDLKCKELQWQREKSERHKLTFKIEI